MEPDIIHLYSSTPPPLDEGTEEDDDEFGEFGGFGEEMSSSFSFAEFEAPIDCSQSRTANVSPPDLYTISETPCCVSLPGKSVSAEDGREPPDESLSSDLFVGSGTLAVQPEVSSSCVNGDLAVAEVIANGFTLTGPEEGPSRLVSDHTCVCEHPRIVDSSVLHDTQLRDTSEHMGDTDEDKGLSNGFSDPHIDSEQEGDSITQSHCTETVNSGSRKVATGVDQKSTLQQRDSEVFLGYQDVHSKPETHTDLPKAPASEEVGTGELGILDDRVPTPACSPPGGRESPDPNRSSISEEFASFCEAVSPNRLESLADYGELGGLSEGFVAVVSVVSQAEPDEDFGEFGEPVSSSGQGFADFSQTESVTQEGFADFVTAPSGISTSSDEGEFVDTDTLKDCKERELEEEEVEQLAEEPVDEVDEFSDFPASDSFADFRSAPFGGVTDEGAEERWAAFEVDGQELAAQDSWATFGEEQSMSLSVEEQERWQAGMSVMAPPSESPQSARRDSVTATLSDGLRRLFLASFPEVITVPAVSEMKEEIGSLRTLLDTQQLQLEQRDQGCSTAHWEPQEMWWHLQDIHSAFGLKFQWGGSHSNRALLNCLGVDTRNILFTGQKKQPVIVPMFASGLGMLQPTKETVKLSQAQISSVPAFSSTSQSTQGEPSAIQLDCISSGLMNPLDGVDPELYELTTAKIESSNTGSNIASAFTRLMASMEKSSTATKKPSSDEHLSEEASKVISHLPDLSFMRAKVLMFPSTLTPLTAPGTTQE
ncbi:aftiphilin [Chanos chanos]|uniref:Aftiphilin n=1 Tax=Chanos chanos TaxID=29144 RepID=A0A6J2WG43_CHACN|nr:aftiphilin-like [Chanos chanos]